MKSFVQSGGWRCGACDMKIPDSNRQERQTDRQTDRLADGQTDRPPAMPTSLRLTGELQSLPTSRAVTHGAARLHAEHSRHSSLYVRARVCVKCSHTHSSAVKQLPVLACTTEFSFYDNGPHLAFTCVSDLLAPACQCQHAQCVTEDMQV